MLRAVRICSTYFVLVMRMIGVHALQAFAEWVPVRGLHPGDPDLAGCHRTLHFGDLATLVRSAGLAQLVWCCTSLCWPGLQCAAFYPVRASCGRHTRVAVSDWAQCEAFPTQPPPPCSDAG